MDLKLRADKSEYYKCSMYYMRRYFGLRESILFCLLFVAAMLLFFLAHTIIILIFFGVTCLVLIITLVLFVWTTVAGWKNDHDKLGVDHIDLHFEETQLRTEFFKANGEQITAEIHDYQKIEAVALKKNFVYVYAAMAIFYYFERKDLGDEKFEELTAFLRERLPKEKLKFKTVKRIYPKKKKVTIDGSDGKKK